ncbi:MAG: UPF0179 family protein [bacterium]
MTLTLVPESMAKPGARFTYRGPNVPRTGGNTGEECEGCPFQKLCFGLTPGHAYQVTALRAVTHPCALHDGGKVHVVTVAETDFVSSIETRHLRGTAAAWTPVPCGRPDCANYGLCHPVGPTAGARHAIVANEGPLPCPAGFDLAKVRLKPME